jgi:hypothetical protein
MLQRRKCFYGSKMWNNDFLFASLNMDLHFIVTDYFIEKIGGPV